MSLGSSLGAPGIPGIWVWVCVTPKCFCLPSETKDGGNSIHHQQQTPPANQGMECFREAASSHRSPPPLPELPGSETSVLGSRLPGLPPCCCALLSWWAGPGSLCVFKALMCGLWGFSSRRLSRHWQSSQSDTFAEVKEGEAALAVHRQARGCPGLGSVGREPGSVRTAILALPLPAAPASRRRSVPTKPSSWVGV